MVDDERLVRTLLSLVLIDSPTGGEGALARFLIAELAACGVSDVAQDSIGNITFSLDGSGEPVLLNAHLDNVPPCMGVKAVVRGDVVSSSGSTVLGADDKAGLAIILEVVRALSATRLRHRPVEVVLTVMEERELQGLRALDLHALRSRIGVCLDASGPASTIVTRAPWANKISVTVHGRAAHSAVNPEKGVNAIAVAAAAINSLTWGRLDEDTTANVGTINGGEAVNVVPALVAIECEARSLDVAKLACLLSDMKRAFLEAGERYKARIEWADNRCFSGYRLPRETGVVRLLARAMEHLGMTPTYVARRGATDANGFNERGIEMAGVGVGYQDQHSTAETLSISEMRRCCQLIWALLTM